MIFQIGIRQTNELANIAAPMNCQPRQNFGGRHAVFGETALHFGFNVRFCKVFRRDLPSCSLRIACRNRGARRV